MAQTLDIFIDTQSRSLINAGALAGTGILPDLTRNDAYTVRLRPREKDQTGIYRDLDITGASFKLGIGDVDGVPTDGQFKLTGNSTTSNAISYNATTTQVLNAISGLFGNVTVASYGSATAGAFLITAVTANTAMSFGGDAFTLFPTTAVLVNTRRFPAPSVNAQQVILLRRSPFVFSDTWTTASTANVVALTKIQDGSGSVNELYKLTLGADAEGGSLVFGYGANSTTAIGFGSTAASFSEALSAVTGIGTGNISVDAFSDNSGFSISFVRDLGLQNITTALTLDASGIQYGQYVTATVTMATSELDEAFNVAGTDEITPTLEIEITSAGTPRTIYQGSVTVVKDLITTGSAVPADAASYYTKSEIDGFTFLKNSTTAFSSNATTRTIFNSSGVARVQVDGNGVGFFATAPTAQPANVNVVSGLINLGLLATGSTYGVLPQSTYTVTTLSSVTFGTIASSTAAYRDVVVTGAATNNIVLLGLPSAVSGGAVVQGVAYKANTVCLSCFNASLISLNVNTATYRITVIG